MERGGGSGEDSRIGACLDPPSLPCGPRAPFGSFFPRLAAALAGEMSSARFGQVKPAVAVREPSATPSYAPFLYNPPRIWRAVLHSGLRGQTSWWLGTGS